ncbi:putative methyltransferase PMT [Parasponia andersonii]|uniref:Methyltransferase n=1 Tax=Parasponia andersonii TaxID=3476 RepID=A0A2P5AYA9_PARAD|nr:putative methyltransferase PMT [Parasponia andersonii]
MRGRSDGTQKKRLITSLCVVGIFLGFLYAYYGSIFGSQSRGVSAIEYGSRSLRRLGYLGGDEDSDDKQESSTKIFDGEDGITPKSFPVCDGRHSELIPCLDRNLIYQMRLKLDLSLMEHYERHCPPPERQYNCLIPPPPGYKIPIKWPKSRDEVWKANIPHTHLAHEKSDQNWMVVKGERIEFPGGGTHFHYGADKYIASIANVRLLAYTAIATEEGMLNFSNNNLNNEGRLRTVLDVGCGVASFGAYLLSSDIIAMSLAPNDVHQNQIQFALERGIPAYLGVLGTKRLPYPSRSFELAHCSRCRIDWLQRDGILLLELDRLLRPGGYFAYSSPEAYAQDEEDLRIWREMSALVSRMCWRIASKRNQTVIWQKPLTNECYMQRAPGTLPPLCKTEEDPDAAWGVLMEACITPYSDHDNRVKGSGLAPWPARLTAPPPRLADFGYTNDMFEKDTEIWRRGVDSYWDLLSPKIESNTLRNIMDMKANMGSFAAALKAKDVWVMNVVPEDGPNTLKLIYDRGLIGTVHNWCEAFSTYPRTYDLLHAWTVFSDIEKKECSPEDLLIEIDRILRPTGFLIIRDKQSVVDYIKKYLAALHWEAVATGDSSSVSDQNGDEVVFVIQKKIWLTSESLRDTE